MWRCSYMLSTFPMIWASVSLFGRSCGDSDTVWRAFSILAVFPPRVPWKKFESSSDSAIARVTIDRSWRWRGQASQFLPAWRSDAGCWIRPDIFHNPTSCLSSPGARFSLPWRRSFECRRHQRCFRELLSPVSFSRIFFVTSWSPCYHRRTPVPNSGFFSASTPVRTSLANTAWSSCRGLPFGTGRGQNSYLGHNEVKHHSNTIDLWHYYIIQYLQQLTKPVSESSCVICTEFGPSACWMWFVLIVCITRHIRTFILKFTQLGKGRLQRQNPCMSSQFVFNI